jgi:hypothetical protein
MIENSQLPDDVVDYCEECCAPLYNGDPCRECTGIESGDDYDRDYEDAR